MQLFFETIREPNAGLARSGPAPTIKPRAKVIPWDPPEDPREHMNALCEAVAPLVGLTFSHIDNFDHWDGGCRGHMIGDDQVCISIATKWDKKSHWDINGVYPRCPQEYRGSYNFTVSPSQWERDKHEEWKDSANVSKKKRPEVIAAEIEARVLPGYKKFLAKGLEELKRYIEGVLAQRADLDAIAAVYGKTLGDSLRQNQESIVYMDGAKWERYHGTDKEINLEVRNISMDQALEIASILVK